MRAFLVHAPKLSAGRLEVVSYGLKENVATLPPHNHVRTIRLEGRPDFLLEAKPGKMASVVRKLVLY
jgi:hypothetical protein